MKVTIAAGAEVDLATPNEVKRIVDASLRQYYKVPNKQRRKGTALIPTPTVATAIDLGGPVAGRQWEVRNVFVSGTDPTAAFTGKALIFVGQAFFTGQPVDPLGVCGIIGTLAGNLTFSSDQVTVLNNEHLFVIISGATAATIASAWAQVVDEPMLQEEEYTV